MLLRGGRRDVVVRPLLGVAVEEGGDGVEDDILSDAHPILPLYFWRIRRGFLDVDTR